MPSLPASLSTDRGTGPGDLILVRQALRREAEAVEALLTRLSCIARFVYRLNRSLGCGLPTEAQEDVVQQVYAALWPRLPDYTGSAALETWVFGFCRNCLRSESRRRRSARRTVSLPFDELEQRLPGHFPEPDQELQQIESLDGLREELERLEPVEREAVQLRHLEGWSFEQIARQQGLSASTIKDRCYRALAKIKERLWRRRSPGEGSG